MNNEVVRWIMLKKSKVVMLMLLPYNKLFVIKIKIEVWMCEHYWFIVDCSPYTRTCNLSEWPCRRWNCYFEMGALSIVNYLRDLSKGRVVFDCEILIYIKIECGPGRFAELLCESIEARQWKSTHAAAPEILTRNIRDSLHN